MDTQGDANAVAVAAWTSPLSPHARRLLIWEITALFAVSLGMSGVRSIVSLIGSLTEAQALHAQHVVMNGSQAPGRPLYDLVLQLVSIVSGVAPAFSPSTCSPGTASRRRPSVLTCRSPAATCCAARGSPR